MILTNRMVALDQRPIEHDFVSARLQLRACLGPMGYMVPGPHRGLISISTYYLRQIIDMFLCL